MAGICVLPSRSLIAIRPLAYFWPLPRYMRKGKHVKNLLIIFTPEKFFYAKKTYTKLSKNTIFRETYFFSNFFVFFEKIVQTAIFLE